jgi:hypothetical protein
MEINKKYIQFVLENIFKDNVKVQLPEPEGTGHIHWKLGPSVWVNVQLTVLEKYTRSVKFLLKFDCYEVEQLIYLPIESAPFNIYDKFIKKLEKLVYQIYIDDGRRDEIIEMYAQKRAQIGELIKKAVENVEKK